MKTDKLELLLEQADALFTKPQGDGLQTYNYTLGRFPEGWTFNVTNSWYKWNWQNLQYEFFASFPDTAVAMFLNYVKKNGINVAELMDDNQEQQ